MQTYVLTQQLGPRLVACSSQRVPSCCYLGARLVASPQARCTCSGGDFSTKRNTQLGNSNSGNRAVSASIDREGRRRSGNKRRDFSTFPSQSNTDTDSCCGLPWPGVFHPLLAGLPRAPLGSRQVKQQQPQQEANSTPPVRTSPNTAASLEAVSGVAESLGCSVAGTPDKKPRGIFYVIHSFSLHPYEAIVFEEALYRLLGQRTVIDSGRVSAAAVSQERTVRVSAASFSSAQAVDPPADRNAWPRDARISKAHDGTDIRTAVQPQQQRVLSQTVCQQQQAITQQSINRKDLGQLHPLQQNQPQQRQEQHGQIQPQQTMSLPSVACAFLHHPPYRPAYGNTSCHGGRSGRKYQLPYPPQAVIFGLSGQPAACVRDPESVLQQQRALFIKRFSGGGTVVIGSGNECFCVGLLLPHTFSRCRPYPRDLFGVCTSLYLGENLWKKQRGASGATQEAPSAAACLKRGVAAVADSAAPPTNSTSSRGTGAAAGPPSFTETHELYEGSIAHEAIARETEPGIPETQRREAALKPASWNSRSFALAALSPFAASRWGFLENDYVVTYPSSSRICGSSSATTVPNTCAPSVHEASRSSVESCCPSLTCTPRTRTGQTAAGHDPFQVHTENASQLIYKVGGNAQAVSRHYGLQHTSFIWDEKQLQGELKDLLLLPAKQPKYRSSRSHIAFLRSVREGLKSHVRIAPHDVKQQHSEGAGGSTWASSAERSHDYASEVLHPRGDCAGEIDKGLPLDTPSSVLLSLGLLFEGHALRRNAALCVRSCHCEEIHGREEAISVRRSSENSGERRHSRSAAKFPPSSGSSPAAARMKEREKGSKEQLDHDEEEWDCVHCVVSSDNRIPTEFKRLWAGVDHLARCWNVASPKSEACREERVQISEAADPAEDTRGTQRTEGFFEGTNGKGRRLHVLPIEAVRELVYELFEGSLKGMRSTRLIDASGREVLEKVYRNLFEINRIVPI